MPDRSDRAEAAVQILILLGVGGMAGAVSFVHVHDWTVANGQLSWVGWTNAVITELIQIAGGLEVRRRKRRGQPTRAVVAVLVAAVLVSLTAQVSQAAPTVAGWLVAALPAIGFLTVVKLVMSRTAPGVAAVSADRSSADRDRPSESGTATPAPVGSLTAPDLTADQAIDRDQVTVTALTGDLLDRGPADRTVLTGDPVTADVQAAADLSGDRTPDRDPVTVTDDPLAAFEPDLVAVGRAVMAELVATGEPVNRGMFAMALRSGGRAIATNKAGALLRALREAA